MDIACEKIFFAKEWKEMPALHFKAFTMLYEYYFYPQNIFLLLF